MVSTVTLPPEVGGPIARCSSDCSLRSRSARCSRPAAVATGKLAQMIAGFLYDGELTATRLHQVKLEWLHEIIESLNGEPLLVVYEFREDIAAIDRMFGNRCRIIGGDVPKRRGGAAIEAWNAGWLPVLALHPASAGHGLNLQAGGQHMAWLGLTWSAEIYEQTITRIHRPGQKRQ